MFSAFFKVFWLQMEFLNFDFEAVGSSHVECFRCCLKFYVLFLIADRVLEC